MKHLSNEPIEEIDNYVSKDLYVYGQHNKAPISLTIVSGDEFRHYELGPIIGYVLFGRIYKETNGISTFISQIEEDDENWFAPNAPMYMAGAWINSVNKTFNRMKDWYKEHIFEGFKEGKWVTEIKKPIVNEEVFREDGKAASPVLEGPET